MDCFSQSCKDFGLTTTLKKTNVLAQHKPSALWQKTTGRPRMQYKDVCMRDMKARDIYATSWEGLAADSTRWRSILNQHIKTGEGKLVDAAEHKRIR